jgi:hypothetical protein
MQYRQINAPGGTIFFTVKQGLYPPDWGSGEMMEIDLGVE